MPAKSKKLIIAIDIDDVLSYSASALIEYGNVHWGSQLTINDYDENFVRMWNIDFAEVERRYDEYIKANMMLKLTPIKHAVESLDILRERYKLILITSRREACKSNTVKWTKNNFPGIFQEEDTHFAGIWDKCLSEAVVAGTKGDIVRCLGVDYLVDDQLKHCTAAASSGAKALLFGDYPWNRYGNLPKGVTRVKDWDGVCEFFANE